MDYLEQKYRTPWSNTTPEEGGRCLDYQCQGSYVVEQNPCHCAAVNAPCGNCESAWLECSECGEETEDFQ